MRNASNRIILFPGLFILLLFVSCQYAQPDLSGWDVRQRVKDSLVNLEKYHYTYGMNFEIRSDSLSLERGLVKGDSTKLYRGDKIVVAEFMTLPVDSIDSLWVKVARDQNTQGWIRRSELNRSVVPTDSISQFIHLFSNTHTTYFLIIFIIFMMFMLVRAILRKQIQLVYFNDIGSIFPMLLCLLMAVSATLYGTLQTFYPEMWQRYYFNPSINPFQLPFLLSAFVISVWLIIIVALAVLEDVFRQMSAVTAGFYLLGLASVCILCYLVFIFTIPYLSGYAFLISLIYLFIKRMRRGTSYKYRCGNCGARLREKGECPQCGAINE